MSTPEKKKLQDIDMKALDDYADNFPSSAPSRASEQVREPVASKKDTKATSKAKKGNIVTLTLKIPRYIDKQIALMAAASENTKKAVILKALQKVGIEIDEDDITDARGRK